MRRLDLVVAVRPDRRLGDVCVSISVLEAIRRDSPDTRVIWISQLGFRDLIEGHPNVAEFWPVPSEMGWRERRRLVAKLRMVRPDAALLLEKNIMRQWGKVMAQARIPIRVGMAEKGRTGRRLTTNVWKPGLPWHQQHEARKSLNILASALETPIADVPVHINFRNDVAEQVRLDFTKLQLPARYFAIQLGTGGSNRQIPPKFFADVASRINRDLHLSPVITGVAAESELETQFRENYPGQMDSVIGKTNASGLSEVLRNAAFLLSVDTGTVHMAAAMQTPSVVIMPRLCVTPEMWCAWCAPTRIIRPRQFCAGCSEAKCVIGGDQCVTTLSEEETFSACVEMFRLRSQQRSVERDERSNAS